MNCTRAREKLTDWLDDRLLAAERVEVDRHVERCVACRREAEGLRLLCQSLGGIGPARAPFGALLGAQSALREEMKLHPSSPSEVKPSGLMARLGPWRIAASVIAGVFGGLILYRDVIQPRWRPSPVESVASSDAGESSEMKPSETRDSEYRSSKLDDPVVPGATVIPSANRRAGDVAKMVPADAKKTESKGDPDSEHIEQKSIGEVAIVEAPTASTATDKKDGDDALHGAEEGRKFKNVPDPTALKDTVTSALGFLSEAKSDSAAAADRAVGELAFDLQRSVSATTSWLAANSESVIPKSRGGEGLATQEAVSSALGGRADDGMAEIGRLRDQQNGEKSEMSLGDAPQSAPAIDLAEKAQVAQSGLPTPEGYAYLIPGGLDEKQLGGVLRGLGLVTNVSAIPAIGAGDTTPKGQSITVSIPLARRDEVLRAIAAASGRAPALLATLDRWQGRMTLESKNRAPLSTGKSPVKPKGKPAPTAPSARPPRGNAPVGGAADAGVGTQPTSNASDIQRDNRIAETAQSRPREVITLHFIVP